MDLAALFFLNVLFMYLLGFYWLLSKNVLPFFDTGLDEAGSKFVSVSLGGGRGKGKLLDVKKYSSCRCFPPTALDWSC